MGSSSVIRQSPRRRSAERENCGEGAKHLLKAVRRIWETYFPLREPEDLAFHIGVLAIALERWEEGLEYFGYSESVYGDDPATDFNMALCHQGPTPCRAHPTVEAGHSSTETWTTRSK